MDGKQPTLMLIVRGLKSKLPEDELERRMKERKERFREVPGLVQKYYAHDGSSDEWAGIYLWEDKAALDRYLESDLKNTIASAYDLTGAPRFEVFPIVDVLRT